MISSARNTPDVDRIADDRMAIGAVNERNSNSSTRKIRTTASTSTSARSRNDFCCSSVGAAVLHADRRRQLQIGDRLLHRRDAGAQVDAFQPRRHFDLALQILAAHFGLARQLVDRGQRTQRGRSPGRVHQHRVLHGLERRAIGRREADAQRVRALVDDHRRGRRLTVDDRRGDDAELLGGEAGARRASED